jgi:protein ImuB
MFACLHSLSTPVRDLVALAEDFTPRYEIMGPLVILDLSGLSRLFGSPRDIGEQLRRSSAGKPVRIAIAASQTAAALLALGRAGLTVVSAEEQPSAMAPLPVTLLGELEKLRQGEPASAPVSRPASTPAPPQIGDMEDVLPYFQSCLERTSELAAKPHARCGAGGWMHPRDTHGAHLTRLARRAPSRTKLDAALKSIQARLDVLRRWGIGTLGALAALPPGEVYERLGARGVAWQRLARGEDQGPLVPCVPEDPFEAVLELEWPIEGLEPLSFVLARLFEPLSERLERADRGAAILHTHLRLTTREVHARTVQLPAPMRDPRTLRTLVLLDLESNPPSAAIDTVRVFIEPTPARVLQWTLYERAQPSPEQVSTLLARLTALMGEGHVGSPKLVDSWKPGAFEMAPFTIGLVDREKATRSAAVSQSMRQGPVADCSVADASSGASSADRTSTPGAFEIPGSPPGTAVRRYRIPIPARVQMQDGRPVRVQSDRRGIAGGRVAQAAGPWRISGEWWHEGAAWDRDEWDVVLDGGAAYRIFVERSVGQWFIEAVVD